MSKTRTRPSMDNFELRLNLAQNLLLLVYSVVPISSALRK